jgi:hypothetical protein
MSVISSASSVNMSMVSDSSVTLGSQLVSVGKKLKTALASRAKLNAKIEMLEGVEAALREQDIVQQAFMKKHAKLENGDMCQNCQKKHALCVPHILRYIKKLTDSDERKTYLTSLPVAELTAYENSLSVAELTTYENSLSLIERSAYVLRLSTAKLSAYNKRQSTNSNTL